MDLVQRPVLDLVQISKTPRPVFSGTRPAIQQTKYFNIMKRNVLRKLPSGETINVQPFHISIKGMEKAILCRDNEDYGVMVKYIAVCAHRKNVIVIIYAVVSNHGHVAVLAKSYQEACEYGEELKRNYAQWFQTKYLEKQILRGVDVQAILLDSDWYVRNALAYIPRNALDNGYPIDKYKWSGFRAMFSNKNQPVNGIPVCKFTRREQDRIMHTREDLKNVHWLVDSDGDLIPESFCDIEYLEQVFNNDPAFWLKTIGSLNPAEMEEKLVNGPRRLLPDSEFYKVAAEVVQRWYSQDLATLSLEKKLRVLPFIWRTRKTTVRQMARTFGLSREEIQDAVKAPGSSISQQK